MVPAWPFVGRQVEIQRILQTTCDPQYDAVIVTGGPGAGKTHLLREALNRAEATGLPTAMITGLTATESVPFGPFLHLSGAPEHPGHDRLAVLRRLVSVLAGRGSGRRRLVLAVDEANMLDEASVAVLHELGSTRRVFLLVAMRSGEAPHRSIVRLAQEHRVTTVEVPPLSEADVAHVLASVLGTELLDPVLASEISGVSQGNAFLVSEMVRAGLESSPAATTVGQRKWVGPAITPQSADVMVTSLYGLDAAERNVLETVALTGPLEAALLERLAEATLIARVERRGLLVASTDGRRLTVRLSPTVSGDLLQRAIAPLSVRALNRQVAATLAETGGHRRQDLPRLVAHRLDGGIQQDSAELIAASRRAIEMFDPRLGERLARAAVEAGSGLAARHLVAAALFDQGRGEQAEELLEALTRNAETDEDITGLAVTRAQNLFFRLHRPEAAYEVIRSAEQRVTSEEAHLTLASHRCEFLMWTAPVKQVLSALQDHSAGDQTKGSVPCFNENLAWTYSGRPERSLAQLDRAREVFESTVPFQWTRWWALWLSGRIRDAEALARRRYAMSGEEAARHFPAAWPMMLGYSLLLRGRPGSACPLLREAAAAGTDRGGFRHLCLALLANAAVLSGHPDEAALASTHAALLHGPSLRRHQYVLSLARSSLAWETGDANAARDHALAAAESARTLGQAPFEAVALHDVARLGRPADVVNRLEELGADVEGAFVSALTTHARALVNDDADGLESVSRHFDVMGAGIWAAEAAVEAGMSHRAHGRNADAYACSLSASTLIRECEVATTPVLRLLNGGIDNLTAREREVAQLAVAGMSGVMIARHLTISSRTANNHLYRLYAKLGIRGRADLSSLHDRAATVDERALRLEIGEAPTAAAR